MEQWKPIKGYEGIYDVSNLGNVRSAEGKTTTKKGANGKIVVRKWVSRLLKQKSDKLGYKRITLYKDNKPKDFLVHRLVAEAFCEKPEGKNIINHKNGVTYDNHYTNLEWCDHRENLVHAYLNKMNKAPTGIRLIDKETKEVFEFYSMAEASRFLGRSHGYISELLKRGKTESKNYLVKLM